MDYKFWGFRLPIRHQHHGLTETTVMDSCIIIYRGYYVRLHGTLLPWWMRLLQREIGVMRVTGLSRDKLTLWNIHGYVKRRKTPPMTFNEVNKKGDLIPQAKEPISIPYWGGFPLMHNFKVSTRINLQRVNKLEKLYGRSSFYT